MGLALGALLLASLGTSVASADGGGPTGPRLPPLIHRGANLPAPSRSRPVPLLIALHASGGTPKSFEATTGFDRLADRDGFVVAYLSSQTPTSPAWTLGDMATNLTYISAEIRRLTASEHIDPNRVYVTGFSAGATMSFFVGCNLSRQVDGIAVVSGWMRYQDPCAISAPVAMLLVMGTHDAQPIGGTAVLMSASGMAARWGKLDRCAAQSSAIASGPVTATAWNRCRGASGVGLDVIQDGTHQWPGAPQSTGVDTQYDASRALWAFLAAHPRTATLRASLSSLGVRQSRYGRWVRIGLRVGESSVKLRVTLSLHRRIVGSRTFRPRKGAHDLLTLPIGSTVKRGRYSITLSFSDPRGRHLTIVRTVKVPSPPQ